MSGIICRYWSAVSKVPGTYYGSIVNKEWGWLAELITGLSVGAVDGGGGRPWQIGPCHVTVTSRLA